MDKREKIVGSLGLAAIAAVATGMGYLSILDIRAKELVQQEEAKVPLLIGQARQKSAGADRVWSYSEQRNFLDEIGLENTIVQEGQEVYFRVGSAEANFWGTQITRRPLVYVIQGVNLENNGGVLRGSSAQSGTLAGTVELSVLENYINSSK